MSLLMRRRMLLAQQEETSGLLPNEYQQVEYVQGQGSQYIDTGVFGKKSLSFYIKTTYGNDTAFGVQDSTNGNKCIVISGGIIGNGENGEYFRFLSSSASNINRGVLNNTFYEIEFSKTQATLIYEGQPTSINLSSTNNTVDYTIYLFARNVSGTASMISKRKISSFKIWDNDILIRDYIPCYRKSDNVIGMYDIVNDVFYINKGTGTFLKGADV